MEAISSQKTRRTFARGEDVGPFRILAPLGAGGSVYLARRWDEVAVHRRPVALKLLSVEPQAHADPFPTFRHDARLAQMLHHQHIVQLYDFGRIPELDALYLEMEWVRGSDLDQILRLLRNASKPLPLPVACRICADIGLGLAYAQNRYDETGSRVRAVHRDLKPTNVLVECSGVSKIAEFGVAHAPLLEIDGDHQIASLPPHAAPEQWNPETRRATPATDIFSLGCILYETLTDQRVTDRLPGRTTARMTETDLDAVVGTLHWLPQDITSLLRNMLHPDPSARLQDPHLVVTRLAHHAVTHAEVAQYLGEMGIWDRLDRFDRLIREEALEVTPPPASADATLNEMSPARPPETVPRDTPVVAHRAVQAEVHRPPAGADTPEPRDKATGLPHEPEAAPDDAATLPPSQPTLAGNGSTHASRKPTGTSASLPRSGRTWAAVMIVLAGTIAIAAAWHLMLGDVTIEDAPEGTVVRIDGGPPIPLSDRPLTYTRWRAHTFRFECGGYVPQEVELPAFADLYENRLQVAMDPAGALRLTALPGAVVWIESRLVGKSPLEVDDLPAGRPIPVLLVMEGGPTHAFTITLKPGEERTIEKLPGAP